MKACKKEHYDEDLDVICNLYDSDFAKEPIRVQLQQLGVDYDVVTADGAMNIFDVKEYFLTLSQGQRVMLQVVALLQFINVIPATNATSERSFSALRHLKSYLRTMMLQQLLNYLMLLNVHKKRTAALGMQEVLTEFMRVGASIRHPRRMTVTPSVVGYT